VDQLITHPPGYKGGTGRIIYATLLGILRERDRHAQGNKISLIGRWHEANEMVGGAIYKGISQT
jgi:hypothetical protein